MDVAENDQEDQVKVNVQNVTTECLVASADAHSIAGKLMVGKIDREAMDEAAIQLERTARYVRRLAANVEES